MSKQNYLCMQRSQPGSKSGPKPTPAEMEGMYAKFNTWKETFQDNIVDMGGRLAGEGKVVTSSGITDGPFTEVKEVVGGFMIIAAETIEEAAEVVGAMPGIGPGASIEIRAIHTPG